MSEHAAEESVLPRTHPASTASRTLSALDTTTAQSLSPSSAVPDARHQLPRLNLPDTFPPTPSSVDGGSPSSSTATTVIVPRTSAGGGVYSPGSLSSLSESPAQRRRSDPYEMSSHVGGGELLSPVDDLNGPSASASVAGPPAETTVIYTLVPESQVSRTALVTPPSQFSRASPVILEAPPPPPRVPAPLSHTTPLHALADAMPCAMAPRDEADAHARAHTQTHVSPDEERSVTDDAEQARTEAGAEVPEADGTPEEWISERKSIHDRVEVLARAAPRACSAPTRTLNTTSVPLDADKTSYECLCAVGAVPLYWMASTETTSSAEKGTRNAARRQKRTRSGSPSQEKEHASAAPSPPITTTPPVTTTAAAAAWVSGERREERAKGVCMSPDDVDARLDVLEEVDLAQFALFLPRTFPLYQLVTQAVPTTAWLRREKDESGHHGSKVHSRQRSEEVDPVASSAPPPPPAPSQAPHSVADMQSFLYTLQHTHREHVLRCLVDEVAVSEGCGVRGGGPAVDLACPPSPSLLCKGDAVVKKEYDDSDRQRPMPFSFLTLLMQAETAVVKAREAAAAAVRSDWRARTRSGMGCLVEWQDGTVGYTADLDGLFEEEHTRQERVAHLYPPTFALPSPQQAAAGKQGAITHVSGAAAAAGCESEGDALPWRLRAPPTCLRSAALTQVHRLSCFESARRRFVHARHPTSTTHGSPSSTPLPSNSQCPSLPSCYTCGSNVSSQALPDRHCPLCMQWQAVFAQVQPPPPELELYLEHLQAASAVPESLSLAAVRAGACVPLKSQAYAAFASATGRTVAPSAHHDHTATATTTTTTTAAVDDGAVDDAAVAEPPVPVSAGLRRDFTSTTSYMHTHAINPSEVFPSLPPPEAGRRHARRARSSSSRADTSACPYVFADKPSVYMTVDDALLEELVLVALTPRGQPSDLELVPPSTAFRRLLLGHVVSRVELYTESVLPLLAQELPWGSFANSATTSTATSHLHEAGEEAATRQYAATTAWLTQTYKQKLAAAIATVLQAPHCAHNGDVQFFHTHIMPLLTSEKDNEATGNSSKSDTDTDENSVEGRVQSTLEHVASQHAESLVHAAADAVVAPVLDALRTILYRRTFTMYEMLRLLASRALFLANRQLVARYKNWYLQTPPPGAILRLLQRSSRFSAALARAFPQLVGSRVPRPHYAASPSSRQAAEKRVSITTTTTTTHTNVSFHAAHSNGLGERVRVKREILSDTDGASSEDAQVESNRHDSSANDGHGARGAEPHMDVHEGSHARDHAEAAERGGDEEAHDSTSSISQQQHQPQQQQQHTTRTFSEPHILLDFVPEAALLERTYLVKFTLWVLQTHHSQLPQAIEMINSLTTELACHAAAPTPSSSSSSVDRPNAPAASKTGISHSGLTFYESSPHGDTSEADAETHATTAARKHDEKEDIRTERAYASARYPFLVPHCPASIDPALSHVLMAVGLRGRTLLGEEVDRYVNTLVARGDR